MRSDLNFNTNQPLAKPTSANTAIAENLDSLTFPATTLAMDQYRNYHIHYLSTELERRIKKNALYSLRSFARDLSITSSWLSEVLNGKKGMSVTKAQSLSYDLGLSSVESKLFQLSVRAAHSRSLKDRKQAQAELEKFSTGKSFLKKMTSEDFAPLSEWYYLALLELIELPDCEHKEEWFAKKLHLPVRLVSSALKRLKANGYVVEENGKFIATHTESETTFDTPSDAIKNHHRQMMERARLALQEQPVQQRDFLNMTLAFESERVEEAQKMLRKFQQEFAKKFYPEHSEHKNSVYQLSIQFFRLDKRGV